MVKTQKFVASIWWLNAKFEKYFAIWTPWKFRITRVYQFLKLCVFRKASRFIFLEIIGKINKFSQHFENIFRELLKSKDDSQYSENILCKLLKSKDDSNIREYQLSSSINTKKCAKNHHCTPQPFQFTSRVNTLSHLLELNGFSKIPFFIHVCHHLFIQEQEGVKPSRIMTVGEKVKYLTRHTRWWSEGHIIFSTFFVLLHFYVPICVRMFLFVYTKFLILC